MPATTAIPEDGTIRHKLRDAWSRERLFFHLRGLGRVVPLLVGMFLFDLLLDWLLVLPSWARVLLLLANLGIVGWVAYRHWLRHLRRFDTTRVSLQVEKLHPRLNSLLVSYVQLSGSTDPAYGSRQMIATMCGQAEKTVAPLDFRGVVQFKKLRLLLALACCVLAGFVVSCFFVHEYYFVLLGRLLSPYSNLAYPTRTRIKLLDPPGALKQGETAVLKAEASGVVLERGFISIRFENTGWEEFPVVRGDDNATFTYQLANVAHGFKYKFRIGDARTDEETVEVVVPPRLIKTDVALRYPAYTGLKNKDLTRMQLPAVPDGTAITWNMTCDQELVSARLVIDGSKPQSFAMKVQEDAHAVAVKIDDVGKLPASQVRLSNSTVYYHFEWTVARRDRKFTFVDPTRYTLEVIPDKPPLVILVRPRPTGLDRPHLALARVKLKLLVDVSDDYGISKVDVVYWVNPQPKETSPPLRWNIPLEKDAKTPRQAKLSAIWPIQELYPALKEGDVLRCAIEATDNRATAAGPNVQMSESFYIRILNEKEYEEYVNKEFTRGLDAIRYYADEELISAKKVKSLIAP